MNKNKLKIVLIMVFILSIILMFPTKAVASDDVIKGGQDFLKASGTDPLPIKEDNLKKISDKIYNILLAVATVVAVIVGAVLGIQFMVGSMDEQAKVKESLLPFAVGCIIVFGAFGIWKLVASVAQTL